MSERYGPATYGERWAGVYDEWFEPRFARDTVGAVAFLLGQADSGPVLELGIGTGRVALPLSEQGIEVHGIEGSMEMVARLRRKPGGRRIRVTIGDFEHVRVDGRFSLVYVVFNTMFALLSQEGQVRCFANVARRLKPGGAFVVQAFVPDLGRFRQDQRVGAFEVDSDSVGLDASLHDPIEQRVTSQHVVLTPRGAKLYPVELRYAFPSELDLMARLARLELESRHAGWCGEDFTADSHGHVSVYRKAPARRSARAR